ncbi:MAG: hypothetical protein VX284_03925 [Candidatus Neomarinimicrobiota bacterium]|nr:hypothetical protein [Candidatus Neomarinimicrobiota bacterium]
MKILLVALTDGVLAMAHNNTLLKTGPIPKEIQQTAVFQAVKNSRLLEYSDASMTLNTNATIEKSKESSHILVNINAARKGELVKLPSIVPMTAERIIG